MASCRRCYIVNYFGFDFEEMPVLHDCCDNCAKICDCSECLNKEISDDNNASIPLCSHEEISLAQIMLEQYFLSENDILRPEFSVPEAVSGLSKQLAKSIARNANAYTNKIALNAQFPFLQDNYVENIHKILKSALNN